MPRLFIWTFRGSLTLVIRASYAVDQSTVKQFHDQFYDFHV